MVFILVTKEKIEDCDCEEDVDCLARNINDNGIYDPLKHRSMVDMMLYYDQNLLQYINLLPQLRSLGYDVIIVNHPKYNTTNLLNNQPVIIDGGAYYIESNAMALVKLLTLTKQGLTASGSNNQIAIIAPSMAGQISKYALSYMEKNNIPHNTYLWVSIDSPHLGANVPLGDQALINLVKDSSDEAKDFYNKELSSPASQQLLIEFHREQQTVNPNYPLLSNQPYLYNYNVAEPNMLNAQTVSQGFPISRGNSAFQQHYNNQDANGLPNSHGWPQNLRKIAIANGSLTGSKETQAINGQPIKSFANDNEKVLNLRGFQRVNIDLPIGNITFRTHIASLEVNFMPTNGSNARIARFKKLFNDKTTQCSNSNFRNVIDNSPGGYFNAQMQLYDSSTVTGPIPGTPNFGYSDINFENIFKWISTRLGGDEWYLWEYNPIHSFIPTFSALGYLQPNQNWSNPVNINLTCPTSKLTPFDSYFGLAKNTQHTSFTKESVNWLLKELAGQPQVPYFPLQDNLLTGLNTICVNSNTTYSFSDICKIPSAVTWSVTSNLQIISSTGYDLVVNGITGGSATITATFQNGQTVTKKIWIGFPSFGTIKTQLNLQNLIKVEMVGAGSNIADQGNTSVLWELISNSPTGCSEIIQNGNYLAYIDFYGNCTSQLRITATNSCGTKIYTTSATGIPGPAHRQINSTFYKIYPNPTSTIVNVSLVDETYKPVTTSQINAELFNMMGEIKGSVTIVNNIASINTIGLPKGIYLLKINIDGVIESHQVAVE